MCTNPLEALGALGNRGPCEHTGRDVPSTGDMWARVSEFGNAFHTSNRTSGNMRGEAGERGVRTCRSERGLVAVQGVGAGLAEVGARARLQPGASTPGWLRSARGLVATEGFGAVVVVSVIAAVVVVLAIKT